MKAYRVSTSTLVLAGIIATSGCQDRSATLMPLLSAQSTPVLLAPVAANAAETPRAPAPAKPDQHEKPENAPAPTAPPKPTAPTAPTEPPADPKNLEEAKEIPAPPIATPGKPLAGPAVPEDISPGLEEIIRMVNAGVSEEVVVTYITNASHTYYVSADEVVYLNDLGISDNIMKHLIVKDHSPEAVTEKKKADVKSLPEEAVLKEPAKDIYPGSEPGGEVVKVPKYPGGVVEEMAVETPAPAPPPDGVTVYEPTEEAPPTEDVDYFYSSLSPYGTWYNVPGYGYCWQPTVAVVNHHWRPYADNGRWLWTTHGWYWYSHYSWGWAPFHYGRWCSYPSLGWIWVPDRVWGPSWVTWRHSKFYYGWAPLPPYSYYVSGFGLYYNGGSVGFGFGFGYGYNYYTYIHHHHFYDHHPHHYYVDSHHAKGIHAHTKPVNDFQEGENNAVINRGMGRETVANSTRSDIPTVRVRDAAARTSSPMQRREQLVAENGNTVLLRPTPPSTSESGDPRQSASRQQRANSAGGRSAPGVSTGRTSPASTTAPSNGPRTRSGSTASRANASAAGGSGGGAESAPDGSIIINRNGVTRTSRPNASGVSPSRSTSISRSGTAVSRSSATDSRNTRTTRTTPSRSAVRPSTTPRSPRVIQTLPSSNVRQSRVYPGSSTRPTQSTVTRSTRPSISTPISQPSRTARPTPSLSTTSRERYPGQSRSTTVTRSAPRSRSLGISTPSRPSPSARPTPSSRRSSGTLLNRSPRVSTPRPATQRPVTRSSPRPSSRPGISSRPAPSRPAPSRSVSRPSQPAPSRSVAPSRSPSPSAAPSRGSSRGSSRGTPSRGRR